MVEKDQLTLASSHIETLGPNPPMTAPGYGKATVRLDQVNPRIVETLGANKVNHNREIRRPSQKKYEARTLKKNVYKSGVTKNSQQLLDRDRFNTKSKEYEDRVRKRSREDNEKRTDQGHQIHNYLQIR